MQAVTAARPYAKAAFDYAYEHNVVNEFEAFLLIATQIVAHEDFVAVLGDPNIAHEQKAQILLDVMAANHPASDSPAKQMLSSMQLPDGLSPDVLLRRITGENAPQNKALQNFVMQLAEHERLSILPQISARYNALKSQALKQVDAYITSAYALSDDERKLLQKNLAERYRAIVILHESIDESLLGGATIRVGDSFTDGSVRGRLQQLKTHLATQAL